LYSSRGRPRPRPQSRSGLVMAIGQRVFVDSAGNRSGSVALADVGGKVVSGVHLADGTEVRVLEWRPRGANETRYRVQAAHGLDGWLPAENLRSTLVAVPRAEPAPQPHAPLVAHSQGRRFGRHNQVERSSEPVAPPPLGTVSDTGGRRFGQH
jgi:hypothetical protein